MKRSVKALVAGALLALGTGAIAQALACVVDETPMRWTGATKMDSGVMLKEYVCLRGHKTWGR